MKPNNYKDDRAWSERWLPTLCNIIGPYLLVPSCFEQDTVQAVDLVILRARDKQIACRVRRPGFAERYPHQFTIRSERDSGARTELEKIIDGWGDWMFYGHQRGDALNPWMIIDLASFRAHLSRDAYRKPKQLAWGKQSNNDGTHFAWFNAASFTGEPALLVACDPQIMPKETPVQLNGHEHPETQTVQRGEQLKLL